MQVEVVLVGMEEPIGFSVSLDPWFQIENGNVHIDQDNVTGTVVKSVIPASSCNGSCIPSLFKNWGLLSYRNGIVNVNEDGGELGDDVWEVQTGHSPALTDTGDVSLMFGFDYWFNKLEAYAVTGADISTGDTYYYRDSDTRIGGGDWLDISSPKVLLVDGNVTIEDDITIVNGGAVMVVARGKITVARTGTSASLTQVHGFYFAEEIETLGGNGTFSDRDVPLVVEGGFIAAGDIDLNRDLAVHAGLSNLNTPAETFIYRTDIVHVLRGLDELKSFDYLMREVAPEL